MKAPATPGSVIARIASTLLLIDAVLILVTAGNLFLTIGFQWNALQFFITSSRLPLVIYSMWALGLFGTVGAIIAIVLYNYRSTWFWWCLMIAGISWLVFPPIHSLLGLLGVIILFKVRRSFFHQHGTGANLG